MPLLIKSYSGALHNAADRSPRAARMARDARIRKGVYAVEDAAIRGVLPLYDDLFDGVTADNYAKRIDQNKAGFKAGYNKAAAKQLDRVRKIIDDGFPKQVNNALTIDWNIAERSAAEFFEWQAFTMATIEGELITASIKAAIKDGLQRGIDEGTTFRTFLNDIRASQGITGANKHHLQTVWRTNLSTAHSAAVYDKAQRGDYVAWEFIGIDDGRQTDICNDRQGHIFPISNKRDWPPLHFNCRSEASLISAIEAEEMGYEPSDMPGAEPVPGGFKNLAVQNYNNWVRDAAGDIPRAAQDEISDMLKKITEK